MQRLSRNSSNTGARVWAIIALAMIFILLSMDAAVFAGQSIHALSSKSPLDHKIAASEDKSDDSKDEDDEKDKEGESEKPEKLISELYMKSKDVGNDDKYHYVGESFESKYKTINIEEKGKTIQLYGYYKIDGSSKVYETADSSSPLGAVDLKWESSDNSIGTIDPSGLFTPKKDGKVTITVKVADKTKYKDSVPTKSVPVDVSGQTGKYVKSVKIIDDDGKSLSSKDDALTVINGKNLFFKFSALVTWHDPSTGKDTVEDTRNNGKVSSTIHWAVGGSSEAGYINPDTGNFKSSEYSANCYVQCVVTGGKGGKDVSDTANVQIDTGEYEYNPAKSLKLKVVYQKYPDEVVQEHTYSLSQLASRLKTYTNSYTVLGNSGSREKNFGTVRAKGYLFKDVVGLENIVIEDVYQFRFSTSDGYDNPVTAKLLYGSGSRYYFPNWDIGSKAGASVVPPILATESNMMWGQSEIGSDTALDSGNRFRLVFGPLWDGGTTSSHQIYYIKGITIVLKGAPPAKDGKGSNKGTGGDDKTDSGKDSGIGGKEGGGGNADGKGAGNSVGNSGNISSSGGSDTAGNSNDDKSKSGSPNDSDSDESSGTLKVYEMISNSKSDVAALDADLPYLPAALPIAVGGVMAGGLSSYISFRRRMF